MKTISAYGLLWILTAFSAQAQQDWGDAPVSYGTAGVNGARHTVIAGFWLGDSSGVPLHIDAEPAGQPTVNADGDDVAGINDDDGVAFSAVPSKGVVPFQLGSCTQAVVKVTLPPGLSTARLDAWVDFNRDGDFSDPNEQIFTSFEVKQGTHPLGFFTPPGASPGNTFARFRLSVAGGLGPDGPAPGGEVEDYKATLVPPSIPANVQAYTRDGQVWITWDFNPAAPAQVYEIYRSAGAITDISQGTQVAALYPGDYAAANLVPELTDAYGAASNPNFRIPDAAGVMQVLPPGKGLCVDTIRANGAWFYSVVPHGLSAVGAPNRTAAAVNSVFNATVVPRPQPQQSGNVSGFPVTFFTMWCDGDDNAGAGRAAFPLMANSARRCTPHLFLIIEPPGGITGAGPHPVSLALHSGDAVAAMWLPGKPGFRNIGVAPQNGYVVAMEDKSIQMINGLPDAQNTNWIGYVPAFNPFPNVVSYEGMVNQGAQFPPPPGSVIQPYTLNRLNWTLSWLTANPVLNIDAARVSIFGHSGGGKGSYIWSRAYPQRFAQVNIFDPEIATEFNGGYTLRMFGSTTYPDPADTPASPGSVMIPGDNFVIAGLANNTGGPVRFEDLYRVETSISPVRDLPPTRYYYGLRGDNWCIDFDHDWTPEVLKSMQALDANGSGSTLYWDLRLHGVDKWTLATAAPPACPFTTDDFWIPDEANQTRRDDVAGAERYRSDESYPAFYNVRSKPGHPTPGTVDYGTPPVFYDDLHDWNDPDPLDCWGVPVSVNADSRGTWGGFFDWVNGAPLTDERALRDFPGFWACSVFLPVNFDGAGRALAAVDAAPVSLLRADLAIRRAQQFTPAAGATVTWMNCDQATRTVQKSGTVTVDAAGVVRLPDVAVPRAPVMARLVVATEMDFGDAPSGYPVTLAEDGARHATDAVLTLGTARNLETSGAHHVSALSGAENDDGVTGPAQLVKDSLANLTITVSAACRLDAWVDWDADGVWEGNPGSANDRIAWSLPLHAGVNNLSVFVPALAHTGTTYARFRVSLGGGLASTGPAPDGEVEDYQVQVTPSVQAAPVELQFFTDNQGRQVIRWQGNPAYSSQIEHSPNMQEWFLTGLPEAELSGTNEEVIQTRLLTGPRQYFRLVRKPLITSPVPLPETGTEQDHQFLSQTFVSGGISRNYRLKIPNNWTPLRKWPLVMMLPGHGQSAEEFSGKRSEMIPFANGGDGDNDPNDGWILCFAEATSGDDSFRWFTYNNPANYTPPAVQPWVDDYAFVKALTQSLIDSGLNIDPARVYAAGFSNGGSMCHFCAGKPDHPFKAFAMIDSGVPLLIGSNDPASGGYVPMDLPLPAMPRPVLINNQVNSIAWPYEGRIPGDPSFMTEGAISHGAFGAVARWTMANGYGWTPPSATAYGVPPAPLIKETPPWVTTNGQQMIVPANDNRPDNGWPGTLATQPGWNVPLANYLYSILPPIPPVPDALHADYPHAIIPNNPVAAVPLFSTVRVTSGTWTRQIWRASAADRTNEVILISMSDGGHNWPEADSPWNASVEVLRFFEAH